MRYLLLAIAAILLFSSCKDEKSELEILFKLKYQEEPLVTFEQVDYPDGTKMLFNRFSFYLNDLKLGNTPLKDLDYLNLTDSHLDQSSASNGLSYTFNDLEPGSYDDLSFNIGVPTDQNMMVPNDFAVGHPLNLGGEYWPGWSSYVFLKMEGQFDSDDDDELDSGFSLHLGSDDSFKNYKFDTDIVLSEGETTTVSIEFDLYDVFNDDGNMYDLKETPGIHQPSQTPMAIELANRLQKHTALKQ